MTLQTSLLIIVSSWAIYLFLAKWHAFARADLERLRQQEYWVARYRVGATKLLDDPRVPSSFDQLLLIMSRWLINPDACETLYATYVGRTSQDKEQATIETDDNAFLNDPEIAEIAGDAMFAGMMAITYGNLRWGEKTRGVMAHFHGDKRNAAILVRAAVGDAVRETITMPHDMIPA